MKIALLDDNNVVLGSWSIKIGKYSDEDRETYERERLKFVNGEKTDHPNTPLEYDFYSDSLFYYSDLPKKILDVIENYEKEEN